MCLLNWFTFPIRFAALLHCVSAFLTFAFNWLCGFLWGQMLIHFQCFANYSMIIDSRTTSNVVFTLPPLLKESSNFSDHPSQSSSLKRASFLTINNKWAQLALPGNDGCQGKCDSCIVVLRMGRLNDNKWIFVQVSGQAKPVSINELERSEFKKCTLLGWRETNCWCLLQNMLERALCSNMFSWSSTWMSTNSLHHKSVTLCCLVW